MHARSAVMRALQSAAPLPGPQRLGEKRRSVSSFAAGGFSLRRGRNRTHTHTEAAPAMEGSRPKELIGRSRRTEPPGHSCFVLPDLPFCGLTQKSPIDTDFPLRRRGRVAEGGGLLILCTGSMTASIFERYFNRLIGLLACHLSWC